MDMTKYPIDFAAIQKGSIVSQEHLERLFNAKAGTPAYAFKSLALQSLIRSEMEKRGHGIVTVCQKSYEIHVLNDADASAKRNDNINGHLSSAFADLRGLLGVNSDNLTPDQRRVHDRRCENQGKKLLALATVMKKEIEITPYKRIGSIPVEAK